MGIFGGDKKNAELEGRIEALRAQVDALQRSIAEVLGGETHVDTLSRAQDNALAIAALRSAMEAPRDQPPERSAPGQEALGTVHLADCTGYVSVWADYGAPDRVELLVGFEPEPAALVAKLNAASNLNSYVGRSVAASTGSHGARTCPPERKPA